MPVISRRRRRNECAVNLRAEAVQAPSASGGPGSELVVVPTYDEAENIGSLIDGVLASTSADVLVVDDSSPDGTAGIVRAHPAFGDRVHVLDRPAKAGLGPAYRAGFRWALSRGYAAVVQMDADFSHPPERIPALLKGLAHFDVVVGSRYVPGGAVRNWPVLRRLISRGGNLYVRVVLDLPVRDATAGFKAFRSEALARIGAVSSESNGYCFQVENTWRAVGQGLRVGEVPITFVDRARGASKMSARIVLEAMVRVLLWRVRDYRGGRDTRRGQVPHAVAGR
ncbi:Dolichyl-phosphate beta-D-mannosyltransferase [Nocardioides sp. JS614]|nr:Dolichyl-phosphate beta-D-mannosyltransferase [Nocardioides sp. JS614]